MIKIKQLIRSMTKGVPLLALAGVLTGPINPSLAQNNGNGSVVVSVHVNQPISEDPNDPVWNSARYEAVEMEQEYELTNVPVPPGLPNEKTLWVGSLNNGEFIYFNFKWADSTADASVGDPTLFADAVAIESPFTGMVPGEQGIEMGSLQIPVNIIFWRADLVRPQNITGVGEGSVQITPGSSALTLVQGGQHAQGVWDVVVGRKMLSENANEQMSYVRGQEYSIAYALWDGHVEERNGNKYVRGSWDRLVIE
ncbi:MAG: hypothetical protein KZQ93_02960 [Candidatus Thiodiazotropha sp. (ex Monitilora ramsayi)]|nr:hypothetical protein [Candidatus Thiodiazotropha sp. (ex Monitilora ramsayi)]